MMALLFLISAFALIGFIGTITSLMIVHSRLTELKSSLISFRMAWEHQRDQAVSQAAAYATSQQMQSMDPWEAGGIAGCLRNVGTMAAVDVEAIEILKLAQKEVWSSWIDVSPSPSAVASAILSRAIWHLEGTKLVKEESVVKQWWESVSRERG